MVNGLDLTRMGLSEFVFERGILEALGLVQKAEDTTTDSGWEGTQQVLDADAIAAGFSSYDEAMRAIDRHEVEPNKAYTLNQLFNSRNG